jgi:hypothetical protein
MTFVDPYKGKRRWRDGHIEVNMGGPTHSCYAPPCPQPKDNWQREGDLNSRIGSFLDNYEVAGSYGQQKNMPDYVYESLQRQMGPGYGFGDYKTEDMKNVINWNAGRLRI